MGMQDRDLDHSRGPTDMPHSWGRRYVAIDSRSIFSPIASCTDKVASYIFMSKSERVSHETTPGRTMTAGSRWMMLSTMEEQLMVHVIIPFVRILASNGTSFCVKLVYIVDNP